MNPIEMHEAEHRCRVVTADLAGPDRLANIQYVPRCGPAIRDLFGDVWNCRADLAEMIDHGDGSGSIETRPRGREGKFIRALSLTLAIAFLVASSGPTGACQSKATAPPLSNNDVVSMVKAGLPADVIVAKIQTSACRFDTSPAALEKLKAEEVPASVILAVVRGFAPSKGENESAATPKQSPLTVMAGTQLRIRFDSTVGTAISRPGDTVDARLLYPVKNWTGVILPAGTLFAGHVLFARAGDKRTRTFPAIRLEFTRATLPDGRSFPMQAVLANLGNGEYVDSEGAASTVPTPKGESASAVTSSAGLGGVVGATSGSWKGAGIGAGVGGAIGVLADLAANSGQWDDFTLKKGRKAWLRLDANFALSSGETSNPPPQHGPALPPPPETPAEATPTPPATPNQPTVYIEPTIVVGKHSVNAAGLRQDMGNAGIAVVEAPSGATLFVTVWQDSKGFHAELRGSKEVMLWGGSALTQGGLVRAIARYLRTHKPPQSTLPAIAPATPAVSENHSAASTPPPSGVAQQPPETSLPQPAVALSRRPPRGSHSTPATPGSLASNEPHPLPFVAGAKSCADPITVDTSAFAAAEEGAYWTPTGTQFVVVGNNLHNPDPSLSPCTVSRVRLIVSDGSLRPLRHPDRPKAGGTWAEEVRRFEWVFTVKPGEKPSAIEAVRPTGYSEANLPDNAHSAWPKAGMGVRILLEGLPSSNDLGNFPQQSQSVRLGQLEIRVTSVGLASGGWKGARPVPSENGHHTVEISFAVRNVSEYPNCTVLYDSSARLFDNRGFEYDGPSVDTLPARASYLLPGETAGATMPFDTWDGTAPKLLTISRNISWERDCAEKQHRPVDMRGGAAVRIPITGVPVVSPKESAATQ